MTMVAQPDPMIAQAADLVRQYNSDDAAYYELISHEKWLWDSRSHERDARQDERREIARNFLRTGVPVDQVAAGTGLDVDEVARLADEG